MFLEIPIKLESYVNEIKRQTKFVEDKEKITLLQLGNTENNDSSKFMYLIYNPFPVNIKVDCNFFTKDSKVYKMYPSEFIVPCHGAYAFVAFVSGKSPILIDEKKFLDSMKRNISNKIASMLEKKKNLGFEACNIYKIEPNKVELDYTLDLTNIQRKTEVDYKIFKSRYNDEIDVNLINISEMDGLVKVEIRFTNKSKTNDFEISGCRLKFFDQDKKFHLTVNQKIFLKKQTSKIVSVFINKIEFDQVDYSKMQIKVTII